MGEVLGPELIDEIVLGSARGGRKPALPLEIEVVRSLTEDDLPALQAPPPVGTSVGVVQELKHQHHNLARLIAQGASMAEVSLITGYSGSYISVLKTGPDFQELVEYYKQGEDAKHLDVLARLRGLGVAGAEELQKRINEEPEKWTKRELMELVEMGLLTAGASAAPGGGAGSAPLIQVNFVGAEGPQVIEGTVKHELLPGNK